MKRKQPNSEPHYVILKAHELGWEIKDHKPRDFYGLIFACGGTRDNDPVMKHSHRKLAQRMGVKKLCTVRRMLDVLQMKDSITREWEKEWMETRLRIVETDENTKDPILMLRVGDKQDERWQEVGGGALRTALMLAINTDEDGMILNGKKALATFISEKVGVSINTAHTHIKKLKKAQILWGFHDRKGLKRNQKEWYIHEFFATYVPNGKQLNIW